MLIAIYYVASSLPEIGFRFYYFLCQKHYRYILTLKGWRRTNLSLADWLFVVADYDGLDMFISSRCMSFLTMMGLICLSPLCMSLLTMMDLICPSLLGVCRCWLWWTWYGHPLWVYVVADYDGLDIFISSGCMSLLTVIYLTCPSPLGVCRGIDMLISSRCMSLLTMMGLICPFPLGVCRCWLWWARYIHLLWVFVVADYDGLICPSPLGVCRCWLW